MKFEPKLSGTKVTDFHITPIYGDQFLLLSQAQKIIKRQETMNFLLDNFRFNKCGNEIDYPNEWVAILDYDTIYKISIMENYPEYEKEMIEYFGVNWLNYYIRFNH